MLVKVAAPGYFARQDTKTPVKFAFVCMMLNLVVSVVAVLWLRDTSVGHVGLASATAGAALLNGGLLVWGLKRSGVYVPGPAWKRLSARVGLAATVMALLLYVPATNVHWWLEGALWTRVLYLTGWVGLAAAAYAGTLLATGLSLRQLKEPLQ